MHQSKSHNRFIPLDVHDAQRRNFKDLAANHETWLNFTTRSINREKVQMNSVAYYYVYKDTALEWRWRFVAKNGKTIAVSSESYKNLADCTHGIALIKTEGSTAVVIGDNNYDRAK